MNNILIFSNNAASLTEPNGRIHMTHFSRCLKNDKIHNFFVRGNPDIESINYLTVSPKHALKNKFLFFKKIKSIRFDLTNSDDSGLYNASDKSKKPFYHLVRNFAYSYNKPILKALSKYIKDNNIKLIVLWGTDIPFLYEYAFKLSAKHDIPTMTVTSEDYPLKKYNYISTTKNLFFSLFQSKLKKWSSKLYKKSKLNIYSNKDLLYKYENEYKITGGEVIYFASNLKKCDKKTPGKIINIFYGGNLYRERAESILQISQAISIFPNVIINVFGNCFDDVKALFSGVSNISLHGHIEYDELINKMYDSDLLIHVEGFSDKYINDCRYAFSTKISDYLMSGKPFFAFGSKSISGISFLYSIAPKYVASSFGELDKLTTLLSNINAFSIDYNLIKPLFDEEIVSNKMYDIISKIISYE